MVEAFCKECKEFRILLPLLASGSCPYCGGSPRECECGETCQECDGVLEIHGEWGQA